MRYTGLVPVPCDTGLSRRADLIVRLKEAVGQVGAQDQSQDTNKGIDVDTRGKTVPLRDLGGFEGAYHSLVLQYREDRYKHGEENE